MKTQILLIIGFCAFAVVAPVAADALSTADYATKYYKAWSTSRGRTDDGAAYATARFYHEVPASMQADVLNQVFDQAFSATPKNYQAMGVVMMCLTQSGANMVLPARLNTELDALAKDNTNWVARRDVLHVFAKLNRPQDRDLIAAALNDPQDEVRGAAIDAYRVQPDAESTFQKFIQDHQNDPAYRTSVMYAKSGLDAIHEKARGQ